MLGVGLACYYSLHASEEVATFNRPDEAFVAFIIHHVPRGIAGITLAGVLASAMTTLSGSLNASATAMINDFYIPWKGRDLPPKHLILLSRLLTLVFGLLLMAVALTGRFFQQSVVAQVLSIASFTSGPVLGAFALGILTRSVSQRAALAGLLGGISAASAVGALNGLASVGTVTFWTPIAWPWFALIGSTATFACGLFASLLPGFRGGIPSDGKET